MDDRDRSVVIGQITSPFGRKGEVKVLPFTDHMENFHRLREVWIGKGDTGRSYNIEKLWFHKRIVILKLTGIDDISSAEMLRNLEVRMQESELAELPENEYYIDDLIGLDVVTTEGENLGKLKEIIWSPAHDVYVTDRAMIPAVKEFIVDLNFDEGKIVVRSIEGLIQEQP